MNPIDLLPVKKPFSDPDQPDESFFYENVAKQLLPDVMQIERTGIPINLEQVKGIEQITEDILTQIPLKLAQNAHIQNYLASKASEYSQDAKTSKKRSYIYYYKKYNKNNIIQRTFIINSYLKEHGREKDCLDKWTVKDAQLYSYHTGVRFPIEVTILEPSIETKALIEKYYKEMCQAKADIYNKSVEEKFKPKNITFNPGSPKQKSEFFKFLGIEPLSKTKKGEDKWDRNNLEQLLKKLELELEEAKDE